MTVFWRSAGGTAAQLSKTLAVYSNPAWSPDGSRIVLLRGNAYDRENSDFDGGDLRFGEFGARTYRPPLGGAVVFSCALLHEATRVSRGRRYAFLPFFYDEAGAEVLAAYEARVGRRAEPAL